MRRFLFGVLTFAAFYAGATPRTMIFGTDWWTDCDDAVALRILSQAHREGKISLCGIVINACMEVSVPSLDAFLLVEGMPKLPIGIDREATDFGGNPTYQRRLAQRTSRYASNAEAESGIALYRRLLAAAKGKVELVEVGYPNVLAGLLVSPADDVSPLRGDALVREKVSHLWMMAGKWDVPAGKENNFSRTPRARTAAAKVCTEWPTPITFLGWEVGHSVLSGGGLPPADPLALVLKDHGSSKGRSSWDPMTVLLAIAGSPEDAGYTAVVGKARVHADTGCNFFTVLSDGPHRYVVKSHPDAWYAERINARLMRSVLR